MKNITLISSLIITGMLLGCDSENIVSPENNSNELTTVAMKAAEASDLFNSNIYTIADMKLVGTSNLRRNNNGASFNLKTTLLNPGSAYTLWMVVFNNPEECGDDGCGGPDLGNAAVNGDVLFSAGSLAGSTGKATFAGNRKTGDNSGSLFGPDAPGIIDSHKAEIHFVVRTHGEKIPGSIREQISTVGGGCDVNDCEDVQFAVHLPE